MTACAGRGHRSHHARHGSRPFARVPSLDPRRAQYTPAQRQVRVPHSCSAISHLTSVRTEPLPQLSSIPNFSNMRGLLVFALMAMLAISVLSSGTDAQISSLFSGGSSSDSSSASGTTDTTSDDTDNSNLSTITGRTLSPSGRSTLHPINDLELYDPRGIGHRTNFADELLDSDSSSDASQVIASAVLAGATLAVVMF